MSEDIVAYTAEPAEPVEAAPVVEAKPSHPAESVLQRIESEFGKFHDDLKQWLSDVRSHL